MGQLWKRMERARNSRAPPGAKEAWRQVDDLQPRLGKQQAKRQLLWLCIRDEGRWSSTAVDEMRSLVQQDLKGQIITVVLVVGS